MLNNPTKILYLKVTSVWSPSSKLNVIVDCVETEVMLALKILYFLDTLSYLFNQGFFYTYNAALP